jgi:fructose-1,6-bisphosphatase III
MLSDSLTDADLSFLKLLAQRYPTIQAASSEIINLGASLQLPKATEHFLSDVHGEYEAFSHVLKSGSGSIKRKIDELFDGELSATERSTLATLIYYPRQKLTLLRSRTPDLEAWYRTTLFRLIRLCRVVASKYSRASVQAALPPDYAYIIQELLHEQEGIENKYEYYNHILSTIIEIGSASTFIVAICELIQRLAIAHLHILGDVYDRSPGAHLIMDALLDYHSVDIQWGNHDILWMGAAAGSEACIANVIRISLRYANVETLENGYGISLLPLASFAMETYGDDPCEQFAVKVTGEEDYTENELLLMARMHKAITIIQLKLEAEIIRGRPEYQMSERLLLDKMNLAKGTVDLNGVVYPLLDTYFPTINPGHPEALSETERLVVDRLRLSFINSEKLQKHVRFLVSRGGMYLIHNGNLLYHGCIPMRTDGSFVGFDDSEEQLVGRGFLDRFDQLVRQGVLSKDPRQKQAGLDAIWYLWSGPQSPLFGKDKMATFERYLIADKSTHIEKQNPYYVLRDREATARHILEEFGLDPDRAHILNGHVPVKVKKGESPVKAGGKLLVIDGGFAKAYQSQTGIAGYTLIYNSYGLLLASHEPFESSQKAIEEELDIHSHTQVLETNTARIRVKDTDYGQRIQKHIDELKALLNAYRAGLIKENFS